MQNWRVYAGVQLVPELHPETIVILDNLPTPKNVAAAEAMREAGCWFLLSPQECWTYFKAAGHVTN